MVHYVVFTKMNIVEGIVPVDRSLYLHISTDCEHTRIRNTIEIAHCIGCILYYVVYQI